MPRLNSSQVSPEETEALRDEYLSIIDKPDWDTQMAKRLMVSSSVAADHGTIRVTMDSRTHEMKLPFYIGRQPRAAVAEAQLDHLQIYTGSRCHVMVTATKDELILVDPGSLVGVQTMKRSEDVLLEDSLPDDRRVLKFGHQERFVITLDSVMIGFNLDQGPEAECLVCMSQPIVERLEACGHSVACPSCLNQLFICPVCRVLINGRQATVAPEQTYRAPIPDYFPPPTSP